MSEKTFNLHQVTLQTLKNTACLIKLRIIIRIPVLCRGTDAFIHSDFEREDSSNNYSGSVNY